MEEKLNDCPVCEDQNCVFETRMGGVTTWICESCGYQTNEGLVEGSDVEKAVYESQPELFKDLKVIDKSDFVWYPTVLNEQNKAMLFPDGKSTEDWGWRVARYVPVGPDDKVIVGQTHKLDMVNSTVLPPLMFSAALYLYSTFLRDDNEV